MCLKGRTSFGFIQCEPGPKSLIFNSHWLAGGRIMESKTLWRWASSGWAFSQNVSFFGVFDGRDLLSTPPSAPSPVVSIVEYSLVQESKSQQRSPGAWNLEVPKIYHVQIIHSRNRGGLQVPPLGKLYETKYVMWFVCIAYTRSIITVRNSGPIVGQVLKRKERRDDFSFKDQSRHWCETDLPFHFIMKSLASYHLILWNLHRISPSFYLCNLICHSIMLRLGGNGMALAIPVSGHFGGRKWVPKPQGNPKAPLKNSGQRYLTRESRKPGDHDFKCIGPGSPFHFEIIKNGTSFILRCQICFSSTKIHLSHCIYNTSLYGTLYA
jgi:hypothetical protein